MGLTSFMTNDDAKKVRPNSMNPALLLALAAGIVEALLVARLVARLLAVRPDNPAFALLFAVTAPLTAPFRALDFDQPSFGAALEFSTLAAAAFVLLGAFLAWRVLHGATAAPDRSS